MKCTSKCMPQKWSDNCWPQSLQNPAWGTNSVSPDEGPHTQHLPGQRQAADILQELNPSHAFFVLRRHLLLDHLQLKAYKKLPGLRLFLHSVHLCPPLLPTACDLQRSTVLTCVPVPACGGSSLFLNLLLLYLVKPLFFSSNLKPGPFIHSPNLSCKAELPHRPPQLPLRQELQRASRVSTRPESQAP